MQNTCYTQRVQCKGKGVLLLEKYPTFFCENFMDFIEGRLHEATFNLHVHVWIFSPAITSVIWLQKVFEWGSIYWLWNVVSYIKGGMQAKGIWKKDSEGNIWAKRDENGK